MKTPISEKKNVWLEKMGSYVLEHGIANASLRPLAKAAGTSDRMLIYHFNNKFELLSAILEYMFEQFGEQLLQAFPSKRAQSRQQCASNIVHYLESGNYEPYKHLWMEIIANASRGDELSIGLGNALTLQLEEWIVNYLPEDEPEPQQAARAIITIVEGVNVLSSIGKLDVGLEALTFLLAAKD